MPASGKYRKTQDELRRLMAGVALDTPVIRAAERKGTAKRRAVVAVAEAASAVATATVAANTATSANTTAIGAAQAADGALIAAADALAAGNDAQVAADDAQVAAAGALAAGNAAQTAANNAAVAAQGAQGAADDAAVAAQDALDAGNAAQAAANAVAAELDIVEAAVNDYIPVKPVAAPSTPTGFTLTGVGHGLSALWSVPPANQYIRHTEVELKLNSSGALVRTYVSGGITQWMFGLVVGTIYAVRIRHIDRWARAGGWSATLTATPTATVAEEIAESVSVDASQISGVLPLDQVADFNDPDKFAPGVIESIALAESRGDNVLDYREATWSNYADGAWGTVSSLPKVIPSGYTAEIVSVGAAGADAANPGRKWLRHTRAVGAGGSTTHAFSAWAPRGTFGAGEWIFSTFARLRGSSTSVRIRAFGADDALGINSVTLADGAWTALTSASDVLRPFVKFARSKEFLRFGVQIQDEDRSVDWGRSQLEATSGAKTEPGSWTMPAMTVGALGAQVIAAWDITATRAILAAASIDRALIAGAAIGTAQIEDAAIVSAKIAIAAIGQAHIGVAAVGTAQIQDAAISAAKIIDATIITAKIADAAIITAKIGDLAVIAAKIADLAVNTAKITALAVTEAKIGNLAVSEAKIGNLAVSEAKIGNLAVSEAKIGNLAVSEAKIGDLAVTTAKIGNLAVNNAKVANLTVNKLATGTLLACAITLSATGYINAGPRVTLDNMGLRLAALASDLGGASADVDYKVSVIGNYADLSFFSTGNTSSDTRGVRLRADGASGAQSGRVTLTATPTGDTANANTCTVRLNSNLGQIALSAPRVVIDDELSLGTTGALLPSVFGTPLTIAAGASLLLTHNYGNAPNYMYSQFTLDGGTRWYQADSGMGIEMSSTSTQMRATNLRAGAVTLFGYANK